ncbi:MAG: DUF4367 domain-containing protein [Eubacterium sp.]|nr:DUF4367 domain-containing protein [Eubacterium sp.]
MGLEEYEKLFGHEIELDEPSGFMLDFCNKGLKRYEKYRENIQKPLFKNIIKKQKTQSKKLFIIKALRQVSIFFLILNFMAMAAQDVSTAFGFNLFSYIYNWLNQNSVEITNIESVGVHLFDLRNPQNIKSAEIVDDEIIYTNYNEIMEISGGWSNLVSPYLIRDYKFIRAAYAEHSEDKKFSIYFLDDNEKQVSLIIQDLSVRYFENKDENEGLVEELVVGDITFKIFKNIEDYQVIWEKSNYLYNLRTFLPLKDIEEIIRNYYSYTKN